MFFSLRNGNNNANLLNPQETTKIILLPDLDLGKGPIKSIQMISNGSLTSLCLFISPFGAY